MPELTVVMLTPRSYETCRKTISHLRQQTAREQIELLIVCPSREALCLDEAEVACFGAWRVVEVGTFHSTGAAMAEGFRAAHAPLVAYGEEHSYPEPTWAQTLIRAHRAPHAAVGAAMGNANPQTLGSWAHLYGQFGPVVEPARSDITNYLAGHHTSYKREIVLQYGEMLGEMLDNECALHIDLRAKGHTLYLAGAAICNHVNISRLSAYCRLDYFGQRGFAAARAHAGKWSRRRRILYATAAPLIPLVRMRRIVRDIFRTGRARQLLPQILLPISCALLCGMVGEAMGYLFGDAPQHYREKIPMELDRFAYVAEQHVSHEKNSVTA